MNKRQIGQNKEELGAKYLAQNGYEILCRNFYSRHGEIDIIALHNNYICFVEVKYRKNNNQGLPEEAVSLNKIRKICKTAEYFLFKNQNYYDYQMRFDVLAINDDVFRLYQNAFDYLA